MSTRQYDNFNDLVTFTRSSGGTALRPISYGPEKVTNGTFDSGTTGWTAINATLSVVSGALRVTKTTVNGQARSSFPTVAGKVYVLSADLVGRTTATSTQIYIGSAAGLNDLGTKSFGLDTSGSAYVVFRATTEESHIALYSPASTGYEDWDNISVKEVLYDQAGAPLTLFNHLTDTPRIEYDADGNVLGLLVEESRTNLEDHSDFGSGWGQSGATVDLNSALSPAGDNTATTVTSISGTSYGINATNITVTNANHTASVYFKANGFDYAKLTWLSAANGTDYAVFNLATGEVVGGTYVSATIESVGNGWYRCSITSLLAATLGGFYAWMSDGTLSRGSGVSGDGTSGIYIYGAQVEAGAFPTSYIPTSGATATRAADNCSIAVSAFGYNQSAGTVVVEASTNSTAVANHSDINIKNSSSLTVAVSGSRTGGSAAGTYSIYSPYTTVLVNVPSVVTEGNTYKAAFTLVDNDVSVSVDGSAVVSDTSVSVTSLTASIIEIGDGYGYLNGHIKSIKYYPRRLTNAQLQELTT